MHELLICKANSGKSRSVEKKMKILIDELVHFVFLIELLLLAIKMKPSGG